MADMLAKRFLLASEIVKGCDEGFGDRERADLRRSSARAAGGAIDDAEIMVVAPALHRSLLRFWLSDADDAIRRAELVQRETAKALDDAGLDARGHTGEGDPVTASEDVLVTWPAERIVLFKRSVLEQRDDEGVDAAALQQRLGLPDQQAE
jgi:hypothetical protein